MPEPNGKSLTLVELGALEPPQLGADGKTTIEHLRWKARVVTQLMTDAALGRADLPKGYNAAQARELIDTEARLCGYDPKHLMDVRTDAQVYADATELLLAAPASAFEQSDAILDQIETQMDAADKFLLDECGAGNVVVRDKRAVKKDLESRAAAKKAWGERIKRLKRVRTRARDAFPAGSAQPNRPAMVAAHPLRFMIYTGREPKRGNVFRVGNHHGVIALALYEAENRKRWQNLEWVPVFFTGLMTVIPPGHGKTTMAAHWLSLRIAQNPRLRVLIGHAQSGEAEKDLAYVAAMFDRDTAQGRRLRSLFPAVPETRKSNTETFDLEPIAGEKKRQPTIMAYGITGQISGSDADIIWFDDPCDQKLAEQETTRKSAFDRMNGTWRSRMRDTPEDPTFEWTTTTLWHHDDPNCIRIGLAKDRKIKLRVKVLRCGGPDEHFAPLWPEVIPASKLKSTYAEWRNPRLYAAAYQSNPQPDSLRKIRRLAYYLPGDEQHAKFLANSVNYISIDPTGTNRDKSDMASFVYAGVGDLVIKRTDNSVEYVRKCRILHAHEMHARQGETVSEVCAFAEHHSTHYICCEMVSGYEAMREFFEQRDLDVIASQPHGKSKEVRLGHVASMFDDSLRDKGFPGAVIEFPGKKMEDGTIGPDPDSPLAWLEDQILNFGVAKGDHGVDAAVYLAKHIGPELNVAEGAVTRRLQQQPPKHPDARMERMLRFHERHDGRRANAGQEDHDFMLQRSGEEWEWN